jgi:Putative Ig domain
VTTYSEQPKSPLRAIVLVALLVACVVPAATDGADNEANANGLQHVTLIGDSVATALPLDDVALQTLRSGVDLDLEVAPCRRLVNPSCPPSPPNTMELIRQRGSALGPNIVMVVGYNEYADEWADSVDTTLDAFERIGVEHVFWLTMIGHVPYVKMNEELKAAAEKHPKLTVSDWYVYSRNHPDWFQDDGLHLGGVGSQMMAGLIRKKLVDAGVAVPPVVVKTQSLPVAWRGKSYTARLQAVSGRRPYSWSVAGRLPLGLHLRPSGVLWGVVRARPGRFTVTVRAKDAIGQIGTRKLLLRLR